MDVKYHIVTKHFSYVKSSILLFCQISLLWNWNQRNLDLLSFCLFWKGTDKVCLIEALIVHEKYRFFHYLNTNSCTNVASVSSAVNTTRKV